VADKNKDQIYEIDGSRADNPQGLSDKNGLDEA
jgi:hypothetical protein